MNREIKFRGKRLDNEEWVYGDLLQIVGGFVIYHGSHTDSTLIEDRPNLAVELYMNEVSPVHTDTVGQFTGRHDVNGKEIYEGDIVKNESAGFFGVIKFKDSAFIIDIDKIKGTLFACLQTDSLEVVGNIHDNPELKKECTR